MAYCVAVAAEIAIRLTRDDDVSPAPTPAGAFRSDIATDAGAEFILD